MNGKRIVVLVAALWAGMAWFSQAGAVEDPTTKAGFYPPEYLKMKNPVPLNLKTLREGRQIYTGHCEVCHGPHGDGQGDAALIAKYDPMPRNFTDSDLMAKKTDGMLFFSVSRGVHGTQMIPREVILSEKQRWSVIWFVRTFAKPE
ncbi:MAG: cytochrome c [Nitrospirae bacterium]|nr:cytochrome c [Nitrospirota bacterium]